MMHSSTISGSMPARRTASRTTMAPSWGAVNPLRRPRNLPVGVRTALTMTDSRTSYLDAGDRVGTEQFLEPPQDDGGGAHHFAPPLRARRVDQQHGAFEAHMGGALQRRAD